MSTEQNTPERKCTGCGGSGWASDSENELLCPMCAGSGDPVENALNEDRKELRAAIETISTLELQRDAARAEAKEAKRENVESLEGWVKERKELVTLRATMDVDHATIDAAAAACAQDLGLASAKGIIATHMRTLGCPQVDHGAAIEAAAIACGELLAEKDYRKYAEGLVAPVLRALVATVTNSQQKGGDEPCALGPMNSIPETSTRASNAAPTPDPEGAATLNTEDDPRLDIMPAVREEMRELRQRVVGKEAMQFGGYHQEAPTKALGFHEPSPTGAATPLSSVTEAAKEIVDWFVSSIYWTTLYPDTSAKVSRHMVESILSRLTSQPTTGQLLGANLRLQQELADWMKIAEMEGEKRESLEEILGAREHELRELRAECENNNDFMAFMGTALGDWPCCHAESAKEGHAGTPPMMWPELIGCIVNKATQDAQAECERLREKLREILLAANLEQQTEGVVQPFVAKWIRKRTAECERLRKDKERLDWVMEFITRHGGDGIAKLIWSQVEPEEIMEDRIDLTFDRVAIDAAMQPSEPKEKP